MQLFAERPTLTAEALALLVDVRSTLRRLVHTLEESCQEAGLTEPQQHTLLWVAYREMHGEQATATQLIDELSTDKNTVSDIVRRLAAHGLLQRERSGRTILLTLSSEGWLRFHRSLLAIGRGLEKPEVSRSAYVLQQHMLQYLTVYRRLLGENTHGTPDAPKE